jgi:hypothetical protein
MVNNVDKFRRIKWADPRPKLKVPQEGIQRRLWLDKLPPIQFWTLTAMFSGLAFIAIFIGSLSLR